MTFYLLEISAILGISIEVYLILFIIAIPTFYFWRWLLKKFIKVDKTRTLAIWLATIVMTPVIYIALVLLFIFSMTYTPGRDFDKTAWVTDRENRFHMAGDVVNSRMLIGKDTSQVKLDLGEPTWRNDSIWHQNATNIWTYDMGIGGGGLGFLFHHLIVEFKHGNVVGVEHKEIRD